MSGSVGPKSLGDLGERIAQQITTETSAPVQEAAAITEEAALKADNDLFTKIRFSWKPEDRAALDRIRIAADAVFEEGFSDSIKVMDDFFLQLRIPEHREGIVIRDASGRPVWKKDEQGHFIEDWNQLTGQDVEYTLAKLSELRMVVSSQVNRLMLEALYARHAASDVYDDTWGSLMDGTQGDRTARSNRASRQDRYHAFFRFYLYSVTDTFLKEITGFIKLLGDVRYWQVRTQK